MDVIRNVVGMLVVWTDREMGGILIEFEDGSNLLFGIVSSFCDKGIGSRRYQANLCIGFLLPKEHCGHHNSFIYSGCDDFGCKAIVNHPHKKESICGWNDDTFFNSRWNQYVIRNITILEVRDEKNNHWSI